MSKQPKNYDRIPPGSLCRLTPRRRFPKDGVVCHRGENGEGGISFISEDDVFMFVREHPSYLVSAYVLLHPDLGLLLWYPGIGVKLEVIGEKGERSPVDDIRA